MLGNNESNEFGKDFLNLTNNSVFGKTIGNVNHKVGVLFTTDPKMAVKHFSTLNFKAAKA